jgi:cell division protein FtsB
LGTPKIDLMKKISSILFNKYLLAIGFFLVWMLFFDQKDFFFNIEKRKELSVLKEKKAYYQQEITKAKQELTDFQSNPAAIEKFARERYMLKKDGEDVYIVEDTLVTKK